MNLVYAYFRGYPVGSGLGVSREHYRLFDAVLFEFAKSKLCIGLYNIRYYNTAGIFSVLGNIHNRTLVMLG